MADSSVETDPLSFEAWTEEAARHGHDYHYYNDSECGGCAKLRAENPEMAQIAYVFTAIFGGLDS
ncbi:hypothetical protein [Myxococcus phage Mx1]|nr:hypothetical protein [Myxococcus phage Mx1]